MRDTDGQREKWSKESATARKFQQKVAGSIARLISKRDSYSEAFLFIFSIDYRREKAKNYNGKVVPPSFSRFRSEAGTSPLICEPFYRPVVAQFFLEPDTVC